MKNFWSHNILIKYLVYVVAAAKICLGSGAVTPELRL